MWYALIAPRDVVVHQDLVLAGISSVRLEYEVRSWHPRKSVVTSRHFPLLEGYLLVETADIPPGVTRQWFQFYQGTTGPLRVHDADEIILRCDSGEFDLDLTRSAEVREFAEGTQVLVEMLGLTGTVVGRRRHEYNVELGSGRKVRVAQSGLALA